MKRNECVFIKSISIRELEDAYEIIPYVMISGYRFAVAGRNEKTGNIALVTNNPFVQEKIAVRSYGKFEYIIELPLEEINPIGRYAFRWAAANVSDCARHDVET